MNSLNFLDTNVWLALVWERHSKSEAAREWFNRRELEQFFFCRFTQLALLRLLTNRTAMGADVRTMAGAWEVYDQCCLDDRIAFLAGTGWSRFPATGDDTGPPRISERLGGRLPRGIRFHGRS